MNQEQDFEKWENTVKQKIWIIMKIWAETEYNFAFFEKVPELHWDKECRKVIPQLLGASSDKEFYLILQELLAQLKDGHTFILPPISELFKLDRPALRFQMIEDKIIITGVGDVEELQENKLVPGLEVTKINNQPAKEYLQENFIRFYPGNTKQYGETMGLIRLLEGELDSKVEITLIDLSDKTTTITLTRNSLLRNNQKFPDSLFNFGPLLTKRMLDDQIFYFKFSTFTNEQIVADFKKELEALDLEKVKGMIFDVRSNTGGNSLYGYEIISHLIDQPIEGEIWRTRRYLPAFRSWGKPEEWHEGGMGLIQPSNGKKYLGPLVVLTDNGTISAAEDFVVPLKYAKRATIIGEQTAGSTGNPVTFILPGGYLFRVCSLVATFPDGEEFVGKGIKPDITLKPTQKDIFDQRDVVLVKAMEILK